jgi:transcription initiation factor TFIIA large subunit
MSNSEAGLIYERIINEVINESRQDFEDIGIDEATLQDLRSLWLENLGQTRVANFSWGPPLAEADQLQVLNDMGSRFELPLPGKKEDGTTAPSSGNGAEFSFEVKDDNGQLTKSLERQREAELKKERTLASLDSDDINSDLDDTDEEAEGFDEDGEDGDGMIMLCLYEKVLRVKNKWKCNLKDGILNVNGKDYTFQKATGESEW